MIDDLRRETNERRHDAGEIIPDLFADFNGMPRSADQTEFYQHDQNWSNREQRAQRPIGPGRRLVGPLG